jgi:hypothetical protein
MSLQPEPIGSIPAETVRIARAACPKGTLAMRLRDRVGSLFEDEQFAALYPRRVEAGTSAVAAGVGDPVAVRRRTD